MWVPAVLTYELAECSWSVVEDLMIAKESQSRLMAQLSNSSYENTQSLDSGSESRILGAREM